MKMRHLTTKPCEIWLLLLPKMKHSTCDECASNKHEIMLIKAIITEVKTDQMKDRESTISKEVEFAKTKFICSKQIIGLKQIIKRISAPRPDIQVYECRTLGVKIDQHLSWKSNTENICKKIGGGISAIRRVKPHVNK